MARQLDPKIGEVLKKYGFGKDACWDCHGTWVVYHRCLEQIAAKADIVFDAPIALETDGPNKCVALCVSGTNRDGKSEWSIGEAAPANNKNAYPYAMAEKRGKDRVILKLIGLHGLVYSEEEADAFQGKKEPVLGELTKTKLQARLREFDGDLRRVSDTDELEALLHSYNDALEQAAMDLPSWWYGKAGSDVIGIEERIKAKRRELANDGMIEPPRFTKEGLVAVTMVNGEPDWNTWANQFLLHHSQTQDPDGFKRLHESTLRNLKIYDQVLYDRLMNSITDAAPAVAATQDA